MQKTIKVLLTVLVSGILCMPVFAQTPVPVPNGDFELWADSGAVGPPDDWIRESGDNSYTASQEDTIKHGGSYSVNLTWTSTSTQVLWSSNISVTAGETYTLSGYVYDNDIEGDLRLSFAWYDAGDGWLQNDYSVYTDDVAGWEEYNVGPVIAPDSASYVVIKLRMYDDQWTSSATVYVDDITLTEGTSAATEISIYDLNYPATGGNCYDGPYNGTGNVRTWGIVTAKYGSAMVLQETAHSTYAGIWVYAGSYDISGIAVGDSITLTGGITEYYGLTEMLSLTDHTVESSGNSITPTTLISTDIVMSCDSVAEGYEDVLAKVNNVTIDSVADYGSWYAHDASGTFLVDDDLMTLPFSGGENYLSITGVVKYTRDAFRLCPRSVADLESAANQPPLISQVYRYPFPTVYPDDNVTVRSTITDDSAVDTALLYVQETALTYTAHALDSIESGTDYYWFTIGTNAIGTLVEYYIEATDDEAATSYSDTSSYTVSDTAQAPIPIYDVQYATVDTPGCYPSPEDGNTVTLTGVVSAIKPNDATYNRFYFQDADSAWSGMLVFNPSEAVDVGDSITATGVVDEYYSVTQLNAPTITYHSVGATVYNPIVVTSDDIPPACEATGESYENMLVKLENVLCVVGSSGGQAWVKSDGATDSCLVDDYWYPYPMPDFLAGERYNIVGIVGYYSGIFQVYPRDANDIEAISEGLSIYEVQYSTDPGTPPDCYPSPYYDSTVTVTGVVVARYDYDHDRFFIQDADSLWSGIYIHNGSDTVDVGDDVTVEGSVNEYNGVTQLYTPTVTITGTGALPGFASITTATLSSDTCNAGAEPYEGMLVELTTVTITSDADYGDYWANDGSGDSCKIMDDVYPGSLPLSIGETYGFIKGVCHYNYWYYCVAPRDAADIAAGCTADLTIYDLQANYTFLDDIDNCFPSMYEDSGAVSVCGVVTAVDNEGSGKGIFLQDPDGTTWEGILWYGMIDAEGDTFDITTASIGDYFQVTSYVKEYHGITELDSTLESVTLLGTNYPLPETSVTDVNTLRQPLTNGCSFTGEPYEGVLVKMEDLTVLSSPGYGKWWVTDPSSTDSILLGPDIYDMTGSAYPPSTGLVYEYVVGIVTFDYYDDVLKLQPRMDSDLQADIVPPPDISAAFPVDQNTLCLMFDRALDETTAENAGNYTIGSGLSVTAALLDADLQRVFLSLSPDMGNGTADMAYVSGVEDTSGIAIVSDSIGFWQGFTPISQFQTLTTPGDDNTYPSDMLLEVVTIKGVVVADTTAFQDSVPGYYPANNIYINDASGPPQNGVLCYVNYTYWDESMHIPQIGDEIVMTAEIQEYYGETELSNIDDFMNVYLVSSGPIPDPDYLTYDAGDFSYNTYDATRESFEGVLVKLCDSLEVVAVDANTDTARVVIMSLTDDADTIAFDYKYRNYNLPNVGDRYDGLTGVIRWRWGYWRFQPRSPADFNTGYNCEAGGENEYLPGDANMNVGAWPPTVIGGDVTYMVGYFRGLNPPCLLSGFYCSADVNGDCLVIGSDVTRLVTYFRGIATIEPCADYPPAWPTPGDLPGEAPAGWPNCETPPVTSSKEIPLDSAK